MVFPVVNFRKSFVLVSVDFRWSQLLESGNIKFLQRGGRSALGFYDSNLMNIMINSEQAKLGCFLLSCDKIMSNLLLL